MPRFTSISDNPTAQQQQTVPRISFAEPAPPTPAPVNYDRALPVWQVEDRRTYWQQIKQMQDEWGAQQQQQLRLAQQAAYNYGQPLTSEAQQYFGGAEGEFGQNMLQSLKQAQPILESMVQAEVDRRKPEDVPIWQRALRKGVDVAQNFTPIPIPETYRGLRTDVPGASYVSERLKAIPQVPDPQELLGLPGTSGIREKVAEVGVDILVPQEVWDTALTLIPAAKAKTVPELLAALTIGDVDALAAVKRAAPDLSESAIFAGAKRALAGGESGKVRLPGKTAAEKRIIEIGNRMRAEDAVTTADAAVTKLVKGVEKAQRLRPAEEAEQAAARGVRAGRIGKAFEGAEGGFESTQAAGSAAAGKLTEGELKLGAQFTTEDADELLRIVARSQRIPATHAFTRLATQRALIKLLGFTREGEQIANKIPTRNEIKMLENVFGPEVGAALLKARGAGAWENIIDFLNLQRVFITAFDFSMPFRQSLFATVGHPKESLPAMVAMVRAGFSDKYAREIDDAMRTHPGWGEFIESGNFYASPFDEAAELTQREELFATRMAQKIPGIRRSQQAALTYLNKLQWDVWRTVRKNIGGTPAERRLMGVAREIAPRAPSPAQLKANEQLRQVASVLNHLRGRGDIPEGLQDFAPALNWGFFSPRLFISRIQIPLDVFLKSGPARRLAARDIAATAATGMGILTLGQQLGAWDVELDPRHPDFGKGKIGKTRFDFWGGEQQIFRYTAQMITQQRASTGAFGKEVRSVPWQNTFARFLQSKLSPQLALGVDIIRGETFIGDEMKATKEAAKTQAFNRLVPLFIQDVVDATREYGPLGFVGALPAAFGVSVQTYETTGEKRRAIINEVMANGALTDEEREAIRNGVIPNAVRELPEWQEIQQTIEKKNDELRQRNETITEAGRRLEAGEIDAKEYREIVGDARSAYRAIINALDLPDDNGVVDDYFSQTYDRATENGILDQDKLDQYIDEWEATATDEQKGTIRQLELAADDPTERRYRAARLELADRGFFERRNTSFEAWRGAVAKNGPVELREIASGWQSPDDLKAWAEKQMEERGTAANLYDRHPVWNSWSGYYEDANLRYLADDPTADLLALEWGYHQRLHSAEAARRYQEQTGQRPPVIAQ